ncbi:alginate lyase family protein [Streptomyces litchfieldiae]|uniref:Alginate lyase family protein n=1 Tax=Streptomyces litchfieldiae TaxID=3075543 RepID=A0ABU2MJ13_9ACTN|nr:alginate lyase family protein [Streptomyces sp. DSM 44938]MDT0341569.1 alginate lyase family protein [Streptomyces sp. DSM 44938]
MRHLTPTPQRPVSRRSLFRLTGAAGLGASAVLAAGPTAQARPRVRPAAPAGRTYAHPGLLHTRADLDRMAEKVAAGEQPWTAGWEKLISGRYAQADYQARATARVLRGGEGQNAVLLFQDAHAAYQNALRWHIGGDRAHGDTARDILNAWSGTLRELGGNADRFLMAGSQGWQLAAAGELIRDYGGFELDRFSTMLTDIFYPMNDHFLREHNGAVDTNYRNNWDAVNMASVLAIGAFTEDDAMVDQAVDYFKNGSGNGNIHRAVNFLHEDGTLGQWEESGRDQEHTMGGLGAMAVVCEMAWNLGEDLYGYDDNRFMKGAEYVARYNLGHDVPYTEYSRQMGQDGRWYTESALGAGGRGNTRPIWALIHNHYAFRRGLDVPNITAYKDKIAPEDGGGHRGPNSGGFDHLGFGTLTSTQDPADAPAAPAESATPAPGEPSTEAGPEAGGNGARPQGGSADLADTGSDSDTLAWGAGAGIAALTGGLLLLRRRGRQPAGDQRI